MATTLAADQSATARTATLAAALSAAVEGEYLIQIGTEYQLVEKRGNTTSPQVRRGMYGTTAAAHSSGDAVTLVRPQVFYGTVPAPVDTPDVDTGPAMIDRAQYDLALADVAPSTPTKLPFAFNYGTALLDLTDTTDPTPEESGVYSFAVVVTISEFDDATGAWSLIVTLDEDDFAGTMNTSARITSTGGSQTVTFPFYVPAGSACHVQVTHTESGAASFTGHVYVQRLS